MKNILLALATLSFSSLASAACNLPLAIASGQYLVELEAAHLQEYQGGGACTVLDAEYKKCDEHERKKLAKKLDLREVLGNICMPHLPPPAPESEAGEGVGSK